ncbi:MAG TPA: response regulator transcription factor [Gaiellaceae bacterium]|nr:response regulator transcription factor [Gaiellaceae bacterium]
MLLADDHDLFRAGVRTFLEEDGFVICAEAGTADAAFAAAETHAPDICLLDVGIPGSGIAAAAGIAKAVPRTAIVMLTASDDDEHLFTAIRAGARGYLLKTTDPARLGHAIRGVVDGEAAMPRALVARLLADYGRAGRSRLRVGDGVVELTPTESKVLRLVAEGVSTTAIGERFGIKPGTVRTHVAAVLRKLDVPNRAAAVELLHAQTVLGASVEAAQRTNGPNGRLAH